MGKNIVVLSDGTGNSADSQQKTNVWRLYSAIDGSPGARQIVFYDDGVGTQGINIQRILGLTVGYGLRRNVIDLYVSLCRAWRPDDNIFMFGFSRGAYTIRVLIGMIARCGLITGNPDNLLELAEQQYEGFRNSCFRGRSHKMPIPPDSSLFSPYIQFVGLWDTVDAYGFPSDEVATAWNSLFPFRFTDRRLTPLVRKAYHALSLDDERKTFHPVLWEECKADSERIQQVWFAGVHANVGGGYPDDGLSLVSLNWIMDEAARLGLAFIASERATIRAQAYVHGKIYDSRTGFAVYYRYQPRDVAALCDEAGAATRIHTSVLDRIAASATDYAPIGLPPHYRVVGGPPRETMAAKRHAAMSLVWDEVWLQRWFYRLFILLTATTLLFAFVTEWTEGRFCSSGGLCSAFVPNAAIPLVETLAQSPGWTAILGIAMAALVATSKVRVRIMEDLARKAWAELRTGKAPVVGQRLAVFDPPGCFQGLAKRVAPAAKMMLVVLTGLAGLVFVDRAVVTARESFGFMCKGSSDRQRLPSHGSAHSDFLTSDACHATGIVLEKGHRYRIQATAMDEWKDATLPAGPQGLGEQPLLLDVLMPLRRSWQSPWFRVMGRVGNHSFSRFAIGDRVDSFTASADGELFVYVNDALVGLFPADAFYGNNHGTGRITVTHLGAEP